ncbi:MAG: hypothetical protein IKM26_03110 [Clostridia bacterium]|nr:hypothetical protein [Clostridia bacterium]
MKKVLALLLAVLMLASISCAWAEGTTEEAVEITFQDIPWGSSIEEVTSWAKENGFQSVYIGSTFSTASFLDASGKYNQDVVIGSPFELHSFKTLNVFDGTSFQIAGYTVSLEFYFDSQGENTELGTVIATIQAPQTQAILDDLEQGLITAYGENALPSTDISPNGTGDRYRKLGAADTAVCLTNNPNYGAQLIYGKINPFTNEKVAKESVEKATVEKATVEITFQDIPWGSSVEEVKSWAKDNGFQTFGNNSSGRLRPPIYLDESGKYSSITTKSGFDLNNNYEALFASDNTSFQIAGYTIPRLEFWFNKQDGETELGTVVVRILPDVMNEQSQTILDDLEQKLITVYGENAASSTDSTLSTISADRYRKVGAEDTAVCLAHDIQYGVMLVYGKTNVFVAEEKNDTPFTFTIDSFNIDGL